MITLMNNDSIKPLINMGELIKSVLLDFTGHASEDEVMLMLITLLSENGYMKNGKLTFARRQLGGGSARGIMQMETATAKDLFINYLAYRPKLRKNLEKMNGSIIHPSIEILDRKLQEDDRFSIAMARILYFRFPEAIPIGLCKLCDYYKKYYNTKMGKGSSARSYQRFMQYSGFDVMSALFPTESKYDI